MRSGKTLSIIHCVAWEWDFVFPHGAQSKKHDYTDKMQSCAQCWLLKSMNLAFSLSGNGGKEKTWPRLSCNYSCCLLTWTTEPTDAANKEGLLNRDLCHQSGFRIIFNSRWWREEWLRGVSRGKRMKKYYAPCSYTSYSELF